MLWGPREPGAGGPRASEQRHLEKCSCNIPTTCSGGTDHRVHTRRGHSVSAVLTRAAGPRVVLKVQRCFLLGSSQPPSPHHALTRLWTLRYTRRDGRTQKYTHTHDTHRSHTAPQAGEHTVDTHTHTQKLTPRRHAQKLHCNPHTETHAHGDTLQCAWQPTHRIPILRNTHKESQSSGQ